MSIYLFTDFGAEDLYVGQVKARLYRGAPQVPVIDLLNDVPNYDIESGAHLLAALIGSVSMGDVVMAVVDPGVGGARKAAVVWADGKWLVGPDNGLLSVVAQRAQEHRVWHIHWRPENLSTSFHGRDLFAPVVAEIAMGNVPMEKLGKKSSLDIAITLRMQRVIYIDHYGNCITSILGSEVGQGSFLKIGSRKIAHARTFEEAAPDSPFWYVNSLGLVEVAVNKGHAARTLGMHAGAPVTISRPDQPS